MAEKRKIELIVDSDVQLEKKSEFFEEFYHTEYFTLAEKTRDGGGISKTIEIEETDTIELHFDEDFRWFCTPDDFAEIASATSGAKRSDGGIIQISGSTQLLLEKERGFTTFRKLLRFGLLKAKEKVADEISDWSAREIASRMEKKVLDNLGLHLLDRNAKFVKFEKADGKADDAYLLLLHGTSSSTRGSFQDLFNSKKLFDKLYDEYNGRILAFEHQTWSVSPLDNVLNLISSLPDKIQLHVVSYSRGGLIGDLLCMFSEARDTVLSDSHRNTLIKGYKKVIDADEHYKYSEKLEITFDSLKDELKERKINVSRYVRVACPASGTTILSDRLDLFFNIVMNLATKALVEGSKLINPLLSEGINATAKALKTITAAIVKQRAQTSNLPGLEAMRPESPFIKWVNSLDFVLNNTNLYVVSGNSKMNKGIWRALKTIIAKLYFLRKNDFVVDTISMYGGMGFGKSVQHFVQNKVVDHFRYFEDELVQDLLLKVLGTNEETTAKLKKYLKGDESTYYRGTAIKKYGTRIQKKKISKNKPVIILIPGIMGTHLDYKKRHIWLNFKAISQGEIENLKVENSVGSDYISGSAYQKFCEHFEKSHDIITVGYDWRSSLGQAAEKLKATIKEVVTEVPNQQIVIVAHSMGGLVVKWMMANGDTDLAKLQNRSQFRFIMLGTPWRGSYLVPYTLMGYGRNIKVVSLIDCENNKKELLQIFKKYEGFLQMLPQVDQNNEKERYHDLTSWNHLEQINRSLHGKPESKDLALVKEYFDFNDQASFDFSNTYYVAGLKNKTVCGFEGTETWFGRKKLGFKYTKEGDGSVTWVMGIPEELNKGEGSKRIFYSKISHGELANDKSIFMALEDIFKSGDTDKLDKDAPRFRSSETEWIESGEEGIITDSINFESDILGLDPLGEIDIDLAPSALKVSVVAGDLRHASHPVLLGHFWKDGILNAEKALDKYLNHELSKKIKTGSYPGVIGDYYIYLDPDKSHDKFQGGLVVGLGKTEDFNAVRLTTTIRSGCIGYMRQMNVVNKLKCKPSKEKELGITALLIGSGYGNLHVEQSLRSIIRGIQQANSFIINEGEKIDLITHLEIIELYTNKAEEALYELYILNEEENERI